MCDDPLIPLNNSKKYHEDFLKKNRELQKNIVPIVIKSLEAINWKIGTITECPSSTRDKFNNLAGLFKQEDDYIHNVLPSIPNYDENANDTSFVANTSSAASVFNILTDLSHSGDPVIIDYSKNHLSEYEELQKNQNRIGDVEKKILALGDQQLINRFKNVISQHSTWKSGVTSRTSVAMDMRTLLDGLQGPLFQKARLKPTENMDWKLMSDRLAKSGTGSIEHTRLINEEKVRSILVNELSAVGKDREGAKTFDLDNILTRLLDHIFTVLGLVK